MVGNSNWIQPSVWLQVFYMLWFHCCFFSIDSRGMWDRSHKKCHYSKLSTFAFYCQLAYSVIHNLQILQVSLLLLSAALQYLQYDRTRGRVWFAPELKLSQTSLQTQLNTGTDCTASAHIAVILCSWSHDSQVWSRLRMPNPEVLAQHQLPGYGPHLILIPAQSSVLFPFPPPPPPVPS